MALLTSIPIQYIKINVEESYYFSNTLFIKLIYYISEDSRQKEKNREMTIQSFLESSNSYFEQLDWDSLSATQQEDIVLIDFVCGIVQNKKTILFGQSPATIPELTTSAETILDSWGFNPEWITDPVYVYGKFALNCGEDTSNNLELTYLYDKIKTKITTAIDC